MVEVLISMAVMAIGVLGIASLVPLGGSQIGVANRLDRSASVGRAAWNEIKARGMLNRQMWVNESSIDRSKPFVIDPLIEVPPFNRSEIQQNQGDLAGIRYSQRVQLKKWPGENVQKMPPEMVKHIFVAGDDLLMQRDPVSLESSGEVMFIDTDKKRAADHEFSWFATVVPAASRTGSGNGTQGETFLVSVAVCSRRQKAGDHERTIPVSGDLTAGYVELAPDKIRDEHGAHIKEGSWLLIDVTGIPTWFKVIAISPEPQGGGNQRISLSGPEVRGNTTIGSVTIIDQVVGVYQYTMNLEDPSLWSR